MKEERVWHVVGDDEHGYDIPFKKFLIVAGVAVAAGFTLSAAYAKWSGGAPMMSALAREIPAVVVESDAAASASEGIPGAQPDKADVDTAPIAGDWNLTTHVTSAARKEFEGLTLGYRIRLTQQGARVTGRGQKVSENGKALSAKQRTPLAVEGERHGERLMLKFTESGARRSSEGTLFLRLEDGRLSGTFTSDAAGSKGDVRAERDAPAVASDQEQKGRAR